MGIQGPEGPKGPAGPSGLPGKDAVVDYAKVTSDSSLKDSINKYKPFLFSIFFSWE